MIDINFDNYNQIRKYIIKFLSQHHDLKYCRPLGHTQLLINNGIDPQDLEYESIKELNNSKRIKYKRHTPMRFKYGEYFPVYAFLIMDTSPIMYAKYTVRIKTREVFWLAYHPTDNPNDDRFKPLKNKKAGNND